MAELEAALVAIAAGPSPDESFRAERLQTAGEPALWEDRISIELGGERSYLRTRSSGDEGGAPIGRWFGRADDSQVRRLAGALAASHAWERAGKPGPPGAASVVWSFATHAGEAELRVSNDPATILVMADVDKPMRRIANDLVAAGEGAVFRCELELGRSPRGARARVSLSNPGTEPCRLHNPLTLPGTRADFWRLEIAAYPEEEPGVTGLGPVYETLDSPAPSSRVASPWDEATLVLHAGKRLTIPAEIPVEPSTGGRYLIRAAYSCYGPYEDDEGMIMVRGRAYSEELELTL